MNHEYKLISVYADINGDILILSCGTDTKWGGPIEIEVAQRVNFPISVEELGEKIQLAFDHCYSKEYDGSSKVTAIEKILGIKGYSKAVKNKKLVLVDWDIDEGYTVTPTEKIPRRGYVHLIELAKKLPLDCSKNRLAEAVIEAFHLSKIVR